MIKQKHLFLTGHPSVGKTTIIVNTIRRLQQQINQQRKGEDSNLKLDIHGFYTQECRNLSTQQRIGFDIILVSNKIDNINATNDNDKDKDKTCIPLSRSGGDGGTIKRTDPHVGKYRVYTDNILQYAIPSLNSSTGIEENVEIIIIDEIGKMEMLCPDFLPSVYNCLNNDGKKNNNTISSKKQFIIGTIPTPRYGRVIPAIEEIRARDDVLVVHVTKDNRDELGNKIFDCIYNHISNNLNHKQNCDTVVVDDDGNNDMYHDLIPFLYMRAIGASSMNNNNNNNGTKRINTTVMTPDNIYTALQPCGPLLSRSIKPKVLILGETASTKIVTHPELEYSERSMWTIFSCMFNIQYSPMLPSTLTKLSQKGNDDIACGSHEQYIQLKTKVLRSGICIWDVLSNVHDVIEKGTKQQQQLRKRQKTSMTPNNINEFLLTHPTIEAILFIGKKAHSTFEKLNTCTTLLQSRKIEMIVLPSSSKANSRMTKEEKVTIWKEHLSQFIKLDCR